MIQKAIRLEELRPERFEEIIKVSPFILLPLGSIEWHGPHNCITVDTLKIQAICERIAEKTRILVAPALFYGVCKTLKDRPGTLFGISELTYYTYIKEIFQGLYNMGFRIIFCLSGHYEGGQIECVKKAIAELKEQQKDLEILLFIEPHFSQYYPNGADPKELLKPEQYYKGDHAGVYETSLMMYFYPQLVDPTKFQEKLHIVDKYYVDPINSSKKFGEHLANIIISEASDFVSDKIHQWNSQKK